MSCLSGTPTDPLSLRFRAPDSEIGSDAAAKSVRTEAQDNGDVPTTPKSDRKEFMPVPKFLFRKTISARLHCLGVSFKAHAHLL